MQGSNDNQNMNKDLPKPMINLNEKIPKSSPASEMETASNTPNRIKDDP